MPELPEVDAIAVFLDSRIVGFPIRRVDVASLSVLKTADPPYSALAGRIVSAVERIGKYLVIATVPSAPDDVEPDIRLVVHLSRAGWVRWNTNLPPTPPRPGGKGPIALRVHCGMPGEGFDLTEAGTQKRLAAWIVREVNDVAPIATLGPDVLRLSAEEFATLIRAHRSRIKNLLVDQRVISGVGNAYSDEILHTAKLSPYATAATLSDDQLCALHAATVSVVRAAIDTLADQDVAAMKSEKKLGLRVHGRAGHACPVCGDTVREVSFTDRAFQYCPTCQTGGRVLADRRMSRLNK